MTIKQFLSENYDACEEGRIWLSRKKSAKNAWDTCARANWMLWALGRTHAGKYGKELRLFACWCARQCKQTDGRCVAAIEVAERYAHGRATRDELDKAWAACAAARASAREAAWAAEAARASAAACAAAAACAEEASCAAEAAAYAAYAAARASAREAAWAAACAARAAQANKLRELIENPYR